MSVVCQPTPRMRSVYWPYWCCRCCQPQAHPAPRLPASAQWSPFSANAASALAQSQISTKRHLAARTGARPRRQRSRADHGSSGVRGSRRQAGPHRRVMHDDTPGGTWITPGNDAVRTRIFGLAPCLQRYRHSLCWQPQRSLWAVDLSKCPAGASVERRREVLKARQVLGGSWCIAQCGSRASPLPAAPVAQAFRPSSGHRRCLHAQAVTQPAFGRQPKALLQPQLRESQHRRARPRRRLARALQASLAGRRCAGWQGPCALFASGARPHRVVQGALYGRLSSRRRNGGAGDGEGGVGNKRSMAKGNTGTSTAAAISSFPGTLPAASWRVHRAGAAHCPSAARLRAPGGPAPVATARRW